MLEFGVGIYLIPTSCNNVLEESTFKTAVDWYVSQGRRFRANIIIWGMHEHYSTLEVRTILADANFENLVRGEMHSEDDHLRVVLTVHDSKAIDKSIVFDLSAKLRKIGCRCILDDDHKRVGALLVAYCMLQSLS